MMEELTQVIQNFMTVDQRFFHLINQVWINSFFDQLMPFITEPKNTKYVLLVLIIAWIAIKRLGAIKVFIGCCLAVAIADVTAAKLIKPSVDRLRPQAREQNVRFLVSPQSSPSFPSNHAANTFAVAQYMQMAAPELFFPALAVAVVVGYSRVYVGVHYPFDVIGGAIVGFIAGQIAHRLMMMIFGYFGIKRETPIPSMPDSLRRRRR